MQTFVFIVLIAIQKQQIKNKNSQIQMELTNQMTGQPQEIQVCRPNRAGAALVICYQLLLKGSYVADFEGINRKNASFDKQ
jgi:hypothetical protein